jgi:DNA-binding NarL/FixJ family response regulator
LISILIVDDHAVVRKGLKNILAEQPDLAVRGEAGNYDEMMAILPLEAWDIVILDISMPGKNGLEILKELHRGNPALPILLFSMMPEDQFAVQAMKFGASGYVCKGSAPEDLVKAIRRIHLGKKYVSPDLADMLATKLDSKDNGLPHESLSEREFQVLRELAQGKSLTEIGLQLFLSVKTIATYRGRLLLKMQMHSNADLVRYALEHHLIE